MPRYIDPRKIDFKTHAIPGADGEIYLAYSDVRKAIAQTPSEDVVEVVRCKDCRHFNEGDPVFLRTPDTCGYFSGYDDVEVNPDDFCSRGSRKDQNNG